MLLNDPYTMRHALAWKKSFTRAGSPLASRMPIIPYRAIDWFDNYLTNDMKLYEFGSGGSTLFFADRAGEVASAEHHTGWYGAVAEHLENGENKNAKVQLFAPIPSENPRITAKESKGLDFYEYVHSIDKYPDKYFDVVFVDGRARMDCLRIGLPKVKDNGYLILDNSERDRYQVAREEFKQYPRVDWIGLGPGYTYKSQTSAWHIVR